MTILLPPVIQVSDENDLLPPIVKVDNQVFKVEA